MWHRRWRISRWLIVLVQLAASAAVACSWVQTYELIWPRRDATGVPVNSAVIIGSSFAPEPASYPIEKLELRVVSTAQIIPVKRELLGIASNGERIRLTPLADLPATELIEVTDNGTGAFGPLLGRFTTGAQTVTSAPAAPGDISFSFDARDLAQEESPVCRGARVRNASFTLPDAADVAWYSIRESDGGTFISGAERSGISRGFVWCDTPYERELMYYWGVGAGVHEIQISAVNAAGVASAPTSLLMVVDCDAAAGPTADGGSAAPVPRPGCSISGWQLPAALYALMLAARLRRRRPVK